MTTFPFSFEVDYIDWRGRDRTSWCEGRYSYDGTGEPKLVSHAFTGDDYDEDAIEAAMYNVLDDMCADDWNEYLADLTPHMATASEASVPPVTP